MHLVVSGTKDAIMMVEAGADEVPDDVMLQAILFAHTEIKKVVEFIEGIVAEVGKEKLDIELHCVNEDIDKAVRDFATDKMSAAVKTVEKMERQEKMDLVKEETLGHLVVFHTLYIRKYCYFTILFDKTHSYTCNHIFYRYTGIKK